ncbi:uncharacterized protein BDW43DRAFT_303578 [Aspergillus alliaceus]|uniref:uncharacterized protein n=1 Tax=Petromyces alliaceus TaxID=209559 RepID=UPI0012A402C8|nr:uncharacterized protein BDW43DRAFT_303578 [Aspergillus alliaceus]KAB8228888.1 hypothetical protein BDW43DRAFT_303578 [Aspergillus alliaceus]
MRQSNKLHHCERCGKDFARLEHLQRHERSHTKERPFQCAICVKAFTRKDLLARHNRLTHRAGVVPAPGPQEAPYSPNSLARALATAGASDIDGLIPDQPRGGNQLVGNFAENATSDLPRVQPWTVSDLSDLQTSWDFSTDDFTSFMDSVVIPSNPFSPSYQPMPTFSPDYAVHEPSYVRPNISAQLLFGGGFQEITPDDTAMSPFSSCLPSLQPEDDSPTLAPPRSASGNSQFIVTTECRAHLEQELIQLGDIVPDEFVLPSRHTLSRLVISYFRGFHEHYPFLHASTLSLDKLSPGPLLGVFALGARYSREPEMSTDLFSAAKAVALEQMRQQRQAGLTETLTSWRKSQAPGVQGGNEISTSQGKDSAKDLELIQAFIVLIALATWFNREPDAYEAMSMRSIVDSLLRESAMGDTESCQPPSWRAWIRSEMMKRTKLVAFCLFNIHTIADSEQARKKTTKSEEAPAKFQESLELLFEYHSTSGHEQPAPFSSLGGFGLIHAIIQRIWLFRHTQFSRHRERGDLVFSEIARSLSTWSPGLIANEKLTRAALHCAHALSIPVQLGLKFVAKTQVVYWSNQHAFCSLECAVLLAKWLEAVTQPHLSLARTPAEEKVLVFVAQLIIETDCTQNLHGIFQKRTMLSAVTVRLWAALYDCDSVWELVNLIGQSLTAYADLLEARYSTQRTLRS